MPGGWSWAPSTHSQGTTTLSKLDPRCGLITVVEINVLLNCLRHEMLRKTFSNT